MNTTDFISGILIIGCRMQTAKFAGSCDRVVPFIPFYVNSKKLAGCTRRAMQLGEWASPACYVTHDFILCHISETTKRLDVYIVLIVIRFKYLL